MADLGLIHIQMFADEGDPGWYAGQLGDGRRVHGPAILCSPSIVNWAEYVGDAAAGPSRPTWGRSAATHQSPGRAAGTGSPREPGEADGRRRPAAVPVAPGGHSRPNRAPPLIGATAPAIGRAAPPARRRECATPWSRR